ncbi:MAG: type IV pilus twitching motility protein PilT [bacterium]|nr:type IV pilus twitching motility protein PilT [bacterium]
MININELLKIMVEKEASDLHVKVGSPPTLRINGKLWPIEEYDELTPEDTKAMVNSITTDEQKKRFEEESELDTAYPVESVGRFRINLFSQQRTYGAVFRHIPLKIRNFDELRLPPQILGPLSTLQRGLVIVTGPTGSGKSTTLAAIINNINISQRRHIMTIEDPIEYVFKDKMSIINQRELGVDTNSFSTALRRVLRQDPDVIMVGEMRDLETMGLTLLAAETGHLVLATMHTSGAIIAIDRIIDSFPSEQQSQVRMQLSLILEGVISQVLLPRADGKGRIVAIETLVGTPAIRNLIREGKTHQMTTLLHTGGQFGMQTLEQSLKTLYQKGDVSFEDAFATSHDAETFRKLVGR